MLSSILAKYLAPHSPFFRGWCEMRKCLREERKWGEWRGRSDAALGYYGPSADSSEGRSSTSGVQLNRGAETPELRKAKRLISETNNAELRSAWTHPCQSFPSASSRKCSWTLPLRPFPLWHTRRALFSHPRTNQARPCLAAEIRRDQAHSGWYGPRLRALFFPNFSS